MRYKYYGLKSKTKESIGIVKAESLNEAYEIAAKVKQLKLIGFIEVSRLEIL